MLQHVLCLVLVAEAEHCSQIVMLKMIAYLSLTYLFSTYLELYGQVSNLPQHFLSGSVPVLNNYGLTMFS